MECLDRVVILLIHSIARVVVEVDMEDAVKVLEALEVVVLDTYIHLLPPPTILLDAF